MPDVPPCAAAPPTTHVRVLFSGGRQPFKSVQTVVWFLVLPEHTAGIQEPQSQFDAQDEHA